MAVIFLHLKINNLSSCAEHGRSIIVELVETNFLKAMTGVLAVMIEN
jgi:hypothetical protein